MYHKRTKDIDTKYHWVREKVQADIISVESCRTNNQTADIFTKPLTHAQYVQLHTLLGVKDIVLKEG